MWGNRSGLPHAYHHHQIIQSPLLAKRRGSDEHLELLQGRVYTINIYDEAGNVENLCLQPKPHVHLFPRYCTQENISRHLHLITYSHNPFCNVQYISLHPGENNIMQQKKMHLQPQARQSPPPQVSLFFFFGFPFFIRNGYPVARQSGGTGNPNHAKPDKCCTSIAPQAVLHLQYCAKVMQTIINEYHAICQRYSNNNQLEMIYRARYRGLIVLTVTISR